MKELKRRLDIAEARLRLLALQDGKRHRFIHNAECPFALRQVGWRDWLIGYEDSPQDVGSRMRSVRLRLARLRDGTHTFEEWFELCAEFDFRCVRCGIKLHKPEKDHIVPLYAGGSDALENLQPLCRSCNAAKGFETTNYVEIRRREGFNSVAVAS